MLSMSTPSFPGVNRQHVDRKTRQKLHLPLHESYGRCVGKLRGVQ